MAEFMLVFVVLCLVTAIHIRIRDLEAEKEGGQGNEIPLCARDDREKTAWDDRETAGGASPAPAKERED